MDNTALCPTQSVQIILYTLVPPSVTFCYTLHGARLPLPVTLCYFTRSMSKEDLHIEEHKRG